MEVEVKNKMDTWVGGVVKYPRFLPKFPRVFPEISESFPGIVGDYSTEIYRKNIYICIFMRIVF